MTADRLATYAALLFALVAVLRWQAARNKAISLAVANRILASHKNQLRQQAKTLRQEADSLTVERDTALSAADHLRRELRSSLNWNRELRAAERDTTNLMQPPARNERPLPRTGDGWASLMQARFDAPSVIPPHETGDQQ